jgi:hypothetical protein
MTPKEIYEEHERQRAIRREAGKRMDELMRQLVVVSGFAVGQVVKDNVGTDVLIRDIRAEFWEDYAELDKGKTRVVPMMRLYIAQPLKTRPGEFAKNTTALIRVLPTFIVEDELRRND